MSEINVINRIQRIIVVPESSSVSVLSTGPKGIQGPQGPQGIQGIPGVVPASYPRGVIGVHELLTTYTTTGTHTTYQDSGLTLTLTPPGGRRWKFSLMVNPYTPGGATAVGFRLYAGGTLLREFLITSGALSTTGSHSKLLAHTQILNAAAATVFKIQIAAQAGNLAVADFGSASFIRQFIIEDIGNV